MNLREDIKSVTYLKTRPAELLDSVSINRRPVVITQNGEARAVVQDIASYEETRNALLMLKLIAQSELSIRRKRTYKQSEVFSRAEKWLKKHEFPRKV